MLILSNYWCNFILLQDALPPPPPPPPQSSGGGAVYPLAAGQRPSPSISDQSGRQRPTVWVIKTVPHKNMQSSSMCSEKWFVQPWPGALAHMLSSKGKVLACLWPPPPYPLQLSLWSCRVWACAQVEGVRTCGWLSLGSHWTSFLSPLTFDPLTFILITPPRQHTPDKN